MDNVINFPTKIVRDKKTIERAIRDELDKSPADDETKDNIIKRCLDLWDKFQCEYPPISYKIPENIDEQDKLLITESINEGLYNFERSLKDHHSLLYFERIQAEIKLYLFENPV